MRTREMITVGTLASAIAVGLPGVAQAATTATVTNLANNLSVQVLAKNARAATQFCADVATVNAILQGGPLTCQVAATGGAGGGGGGSTAVVITNALNNLSVQVLARNDRAATQLCADLAAVNPILSPDLLLCAFA